MGPEKNNAMFDSSPRNSRGISFDLLKKTIEERAPGKPREATHSFTIKK